MRAISFPFYAVIKTSGGYRKFTFENYLEYLEFTAKTNTAVESLSFLNSSGWDVSDFEHSGFKEILIKSISTLSSLRYIELGFSALNIHDNIISLVNFLSLFKNLKEVRLVLRAKSVLDIASFISNSTGTLKSLKTLRIESHFMSRIEVLKILSALSASLIEEFFLEIKSENSLADKDAYPERKEFKNNHTLRRIEIDGIVFPRQVNHLCIFDFLNKCNALQVVRFSGLKTLDLQHANKLVELLQNQTSIEEFYDENSGSLVAESLNRKIDDFSYRAMNFMSLGGFNKNSARESMYLVSFFTKLFQKFCLAELKMTWQEEFYPLLKSLTYPSFLCSLKIGSSAQIVILKKREIEDVGSPKDGIFKNQRLLNLPRPIVESLGWSPIIERNRNLFKMKMKMILNNQPMEFSLFDFQVFESQMVVMLQDKQLQVLMNIKFQDLKKAWSKLNDCKSMTSLAICGSIENSDSCFSLLPQELTSQVFSYIKFRDINIFSK